MHLRGRGLAEDLFQRCGASGRALGYLLIGGRDGRRGCCALSFSDPDGAELKAGARGEELSVVRKGCCLG